MTTKIMILSNQFLRGLNSTIIFLFVFSFNHGSVLAQIQGQDSQQFFEQGNQLIEQQIQEMQREARENLEVDRQRREESQGRELDGEQDQQPKIEQAPEEKLKSPSPNPI